MLSGWTGAVGDIWVVIVISIGVSRVFEGGLLGLFLVRAVGVVSFSGLFVQINPAKSKLSLWSEAIDAAAGGAWPNGIFSEC